MQDLGITETFNMAKFKYSYTLHGIKQTGQSELCANGHSHEVHTLTTLAYEFLSLLIFVFCFVSLRKLKNPAILTKLILYLYSSLESMAPKDSTRPEIHWRAKTFSTLSFDRIVIYHMGYKQFDFTFKAFKMRYCFCESIKTFFF